MEFFLSNGKPKLIKARLSADRAVADVGCQKRGDRTVMVSGETQTEISLPNQTPIIWQPIVRDAYPVVDASAHQVMSAIAMEKECEDSTMSDTQAPAARTGSRPADDSEDEDID